MCAAIMKSFSVRPPAITAAIMAVQQYEQQNECCTTTCYFTDII